MIVIPSVFILILMLCSGLQLKIGGARSNPDRSDMAGAPQLSGCAGLCRHALRSPSPNTATQIYYHHPTLVVLSSMEYRYTQDLLLLDECLANSPIRLPPMFATINLPLGCRVLGPPDRSQFPFVHTSVIPSFCIGAATTAARCGIPDSTIKMFGQWESSAYMLYIRTPCETLASISKVLVTDLA